MPYKPSIALPVNTFFVRSNFPNTRPYYSTRAIAVKDAVSGYLIINWNDTTSYTPKTGVKVVNILDVAGLGIAQRIMGLANLELAPPSTWIETYSDLPAPLVVSRVGAGTYALTLSNAFPGLIPEQDFIVLDEGTHSATAIGRCKISKTGNSVVGIVTYNAAGNLSDGILLGTAITIEHIPIT